MAKDPAFLFYSKDWLEGTSEMTSEEKGVYIDLLAAQHQRGSLPTDTKRLCKLSRLGEEEFLKIWVEVSKKFKPNGEPNGEIRLVNKRLTEVTTERLEKGHKNRIISALAVAVRSSKVPYEVKYEAKKGFNISDFLEIPEPKITESVTEWFNLRLKSIANANEDANANANNIYNSINNNIDNKEEKNFEKNKNNFPVSTSFNGIPEVQIQNAILGVRLSQNIDIGKEAVCDFWENFKVENLNGENYYDSLEKIHTHFQRWIKKQKINNGSKSFNGSDSGEKLGTSAARIKKLKEW